MSLNLQVVQEDLDAFINALDRTLTEVAAEVLAQMADTAAGRLSKLDQAAEHYELAKLWTYEIKMNDDGGTGEVLSQAEEMIFFNKVFSAQGRVGSPLYPVQGNRILAILEGGANDHEIFAGTVNPEARALTIPINGSDTDYRLASRVEHPGVQGNYHIETVGKEGIDELDTFANLASTLVALEF